VRLRCDVDPAIVELLEGIGRMLQQIDAKLEKIADLLEETE
jgi:hypothetical protein